jgi:predicted MFS family arabinose efflux permease
MSPSPTLPAVSERKIVLLLAAVMFVNVLDFMMVMPLGPDFARALGIPTARLGIIGGSYTAAAAVAGLIGTLFLDRFDRRSALAVAMGGLVTATALGGLAHSFEMLVATRVLAGVFGGPASSLSMSILADVVAPERRGKAISQVMGAFAVASVLGVPLGMRLALIGGWPTPFFAVAGMGLVVAVAAIAIMPPMRGHLQRLREPAQSRSLGAFLSDGTVLLALSGVVAVNMGTFLLVPNLAAWLQHNLHFPRESLEWLYLVGGVLSFAAMRVAGAFVDRRGSVPVTVFGSGLMIIIVALAFLPAQTPLHPALVFAGFMVANGTRAVALNALSTRVPLPTERARFMSAQSAAQHMAAALGATISSLVLVNRPDGSLAGLDRLGLMAMALGATVPMFVAAVSARVRARATASAPVAAAAGR